ncbi:MAG: AAA family ATPase [Devosia sp.]
MTEDLEQREPDQLEGVQPPEYRTRLVGHADARASLLSQLDEARLPGGILIHGPRGIGKATLAFDIAREIFKRTGDDDSAHIHDQVAAGSYPNLRVLRKAGKETGKGFYTVIRVEEVRELIERLHRTRGRAGHRVVIVDAIDDSNASSANALLKILEEPPADTLFLLISHRPGQLLPTIKSRCHQLALRPLSEADLRAVLADDMPDADKEAMDRAVALAGGRPRRGFEALLMTDSGNLSALKAWLDDPARPAVGAHLGLADALGADRDSAAAHFARDIILEWLAAEARSAAGAGTSARGRLASATALWDKAHALFADADEYNLDARQTLIVIFDAIRRHVQRQASLTETK